MIERKDVETILAEVHSMAEINQVAVGDIAHPVSGDTLAALCRAWLAVEEAPVGEVVEQWEAGAEIDFDSFIPPGSITFQRVRIVKEVG